MLLKMLSLTAFLMICVAVPMAIQFSLMFCSQIPAKAGLGPVFIRFHTSFLTNMALVRSDYLS